MIDIHFHCLPGIDDGPSDWDGAVNLCRLAALDGVKTIVATPHVLRGEWVNERTAERDLLLAELNRRLAGMPIVLPGCEYYFSLDALELWRQGVEGPLIGLNRSHFMLIEFSAVRVPEQAAAVFYELTLLGVTPVIAHPERNVVFAENPTRLKRFIEIGARTQVTAGSLTGDFGRRVLATTEEFFKLGLVHSVASDAHSVDKRPPRMGAARDIVRRRWGTDVEAAVFEEMPRDVVGISECARQDENLV